MRRLLLPVIIVLCLSLAGCGKNAAMDSYKRFSETLENGRCISFTARMRSEYEDKTFAFTLDFAEDKEGCCVTVKEPGLIRGISARIGKCETKLEFDGLILDTGELDDFGLSPMSALPLLTDAIRNGLCESAWEENGETVVSIAASDTLTVQLWFDKYTLMPTHAEMISEGKVRVFADIEDWNLSQLNTLETDDERFAEEDLG